MKTIKEFRFEIAGLALMAIMCGSALLSTGCMTTASGRRDISDAAADITAPALNLTIFLATREILKSEPKAAPFIRAAIPIIRALDLASLDKAAIVKALQASSINEFRTVEGEEILGRIVDIFEAARQAHGMTLVQDRENWRRVADAFLDGIEGAANLTE